MHRVVSPAPGQTRLSIPFFFNPALDSTVPRIELPADLAADAPGVSQDPGNIISGTFGDNDPAPAPGPMSPGVHPRKLSGLRVLDVVAGPR